MARRRRIEFPGAIYHITSRGNAGADIYHDALDRRLWIGILAQVIDRYGWRCHGYCLMGNHYHLLVETPQANLSRGMRQLNGVYTQKFNFQHQRYGHVFQGRYGAVVVDRDSYLLEVCRYIVLNPVRAGLAERPEDWPWSSHRALLDDAPPPAWLEVDWVRSQFASREAYREFIKDGLRMATPAGSSSAAEIEKYFATVNRPPLSDLQIQNTARGAWMMRAYETHGYSIRDIALFAGLAGSTVRHLIARWKHNASTRDIGDAP